MAEGAKTPKEAAREYSSLGWYPLRLRPKSKACTDPDWLHRTYNAAEFEDGDNVGLRLVPKDDKRAVKLCAVDLDCQEASGLADRFLPKGAPAWGRASKKLSQALYDCPLERTVAFKDGDSTILELRTNHQSMAPPSTHPDGERLEWVRGPHAAPKAEPAALLRACRLLATACLLGRRWAGPGSRHEWTLAVAGALRQIGLDEREALDVVAGGAQVAGDRKEHDRATEVKTTYSRPDGETLGFGKLAELAGETLGDALRKVWAWQAPKEKRRSADDPAACKDAIEKLGLKFARDRFSGKATLRRGDGPPAPLDDEAVRATWFAIDERFGFRPSREFFAEWVQYEADRNPYHPVRDWLDGLEWDGTHRVGTWLSAYGGAADAPYQRAVGALVLVAAVRRVRRPGAKFDELLVLEGEQGQNKSSALRALCPVDDWFSDDLPMGVEAKQVIERTTGKWIIEVAELTNMRRAQIEALKASLSRQVDGPVRLAYGRMSVEVPRQFVPIGTTNSASYLRDPTGNRRFWPVAVKKFDVEAILRDRDQLWAEAARLESSGVPVRLDRDLWAQAAVQQDRRRVEDPWEDSLSRYGSEGAPEKVRTREIYDTLGVDITRRDGVTQSRIAEIMQRFGYRSATIRIGEETHKGWRKDMAQVRAARALAFTPPDGQDTDNG